MLLKHERAAAAINAQVQCMANGAAVSPAAFGRAIYWPRFRVRAAAGRTYALADRFAATLEQLMRAADQELLSAAA